MAREHITLRIEEEVLKNIKKVANTECRTPSGLINKILTEWHVSTSKKSK